MNVWIVAGALGAVALFAWSLCRAAADGDAELARTRPTRLAPVASSYDPALAAAMAAHPAGKARPTTPLRVVKDTDHR